MTADPGGDPGPAHGRRLTLTPISFDIVIALSQDPAGLRLSALAHAIGSPVSSVQAVLRVLVANGLVAREDANPPLYRIDAAHPGRSALEELGLVLPDAAHTIGIALRANPAIEVAVVDAAGFVAGVARAATPEDRARFASALATVERARPGVPQVELYDVEELSRMLDVSIGFRDRARRAILLKGRLPRRGDGLRRPGVGPETSVESFG